MASANIVVLCGNLTRDPEVRQIPSGMSVADLGLAINESYKNKSGELVETTCYVDVVVWGKTAENCGQYLRKGSAILVEGRLQLDQWEKDGEKRSKLRVRADRIQFLGSPRRDGDAASGGAPARRPETTSSPKPPPADDDIPF